VFIDPVDDKGESGIYGDVEKSDSFTYDAAMIGNVPDPGTGNTHYPATAGNIQVHYNS
jgi:hypothetical protein